MESGQCLKLQPIFLKRFECFLVFCRVGRTVQSPLDMERGSKDPILDPEDQGPKALNSSAR